MTERNPNNQSMQESYDVVQNYEMHVGRRAENIEKSLLNRLHYGKQNSEESDQ